MTFYEELEHAVKHERDALLALPILAKTLRGETTLGQYIAFLTQAYHHVKHTLPLLMACGARVPESQEWLRRALARYIAEETGHEDWILNDIRACGGDVEAARKQGPNLHTELMVGYAYDTVMRGNPCGFLGMVYVLEGTSVRLASRAAEALQRSLRLPDEAFTYLRSHGALDQEHVLFFQGIVNRLETLEDRQAVTHCAKTFFHLYANIFRSLEGEA